MKNLDVSVIILTFNESLHIERCITSLSKKFRNIFVVDSFSTDGTVAIAESLGAKVYQRKWTNYSDQFQWALDNCPIDTNWVMRLDADEYLEPDLVSELSIKLDGKSDDVVGFYIRRKYFFLGRWVKHGAVYPLVLLRIWRHGQGRIEQRWMDEHIVIDNSALLENLSGHIVDDNLNNTRWWTDKHNKYADREMLDILIKKHHLLSSDEHLTNESSLSQAKLKRIIKESIYNKLPVFVRPFIYFMYRYFIRLGFLDGASGFAFHFFQGYWYRSLVDLRVYEAEKLFGRNDTKEEKIMKLEAITGLKIK